MKRKALVIALAGLALAAAGRGGRKAAGPAAHGPLLECAYSSSGDMNGNLYRASLKAGEDGVLRLTIEESAAHDLPIQVRVYRAEDDALDQLRAIIDHYDLSAWSKLPMDTEMFALDAPSTGIRMAFDDREQGAWSRESFSVDYGAKLPKGGHDALKEFTGCLFQWEQEDRLLESWYENHDQVRLGELPRDPAVLED